MHQLTLRDRLGMVAAVTAVLTLGIGSCAYSRGGMTMGSSRPSLAPVGADGSRPATLDLLAGGNEPGAAQAAPPAPISSAASVASGALVVHVVGAVKSPGVYRLKLGDRINDAIHAAGGFRSGAAQDVLNLADTVRDADQIYVPTTGDADSDSGAAPLAQSMGKTSRSRKSRSVAGRRSYVVRGTPPTSRSGGGLQPIILAPPRPLSPLPGFSYAPGGSSAPVAGIRVEPGGTVAAPIVMTTGRTLGRSRQVIIAASDVTDAPDDSVAEVAAPQQMVAVSKRAAGGKGGSESKKFKNPGDGVIHLNSATAAQIELVPGIGPSTAIKVLEYRAQIGRFSAVEQLMDVKGIGEKKFAKMQPFLAL